MSRLSVPGLVVIALGVAAAVLARRLGGGVSGARYYAFKLGGLALTMAGALIAVRAFG